LNKILVFIRQSVPWTQSVRRRREKVFDPGPVQVRFVVGKAAMGQVFLGLLRCHYHFISDSVRSSEGSLRTFTERNSLQEIGNLGGGGEKVGKTLVMNVCVCECACVAHSHTYRLIYLKVLTTNYRLL
jgi:hypothetical protein